MHKLRRAFMFSLLYCFLIVLLSLLSFVPLANNYLYKSQVPARLQVIIAYCSHLLNFDNSSTQTFAQLLAKSLEQSANKANNLWLPALSSLPSLPFSFTLSVSVSVSILQLPLRPLLKNYDTVAEFMMHRAEQAAGKRKRKPLRR